MAAGHLGLAPSPGTSFTPANPYTHSAGKFALPGLGSQAAWHSARLAAERGQQGGASGRGAEDVAGRPGHEQNPRPGARGPEGEGTLDGSRVSLGGGQAVQPDREQASWEEAGWRKNQAQSMAVPGRQHAAWPACPSPGQQRGIWGRRGGRGRGRMRVHGASSGAAATELSLRCRASPCSPAEEGQARQAGPRAVKEKNIPRPANCCSQLFPPPPTGGEKKKAVLPLEADANGCRILTISCINQAFPCKVSPG